jgi:undecaprenyl-diphosphatase
LFVFREDIKTLFAGIFRFRMNAETQYVLRLLLSAVPVGDHRYVFQGRSEWTFSGNLLLVGVCLLLTSLLIALSHFLKTSGKKRITYSMRSS